MKKECSFCSSTEVILYSGHNYCSECISFVDQPTIHQWIMDKYPRIMERAVTRVLTDLFETKWYSFVTFSKLHTLYSRGPWDEDEQRYEISQHDYILFVFKQYITQHYTKYRNAYDHINSTLATATGTVRDIYV